MASVYRASRGRHRVNLPHHPDLLKLCASILEPQWAQTLNESAMYLFCGDLRHFFHQIPLHPDIGSYFCLKCSGKAYRYNVLSMG
jgi:hypothetical protein